MNSIKEILSTKVDSGLFPIVVRVGVYGLLLTIILVNQAIVFDSSEILSILSFSIIMILCETMLMQFKDTQKLVYHLFAILALMFFLFTLLNRANFANDIWYRNRVIDNRIDDLIETAPSAIIVLDGLGNVKNINYNTTSMLGYDRSELVGQSIYNILENPNFEEFDFKRMNGVDSETGALWLSTQDINRKLIKKDGTVISCRIYLLGIKIISKNMDEWNSSTPKNIEFYTIIHKVS